MNLIPGVWKGPGEEQGLGLIAIGNGSLPEESLMAAVTVPRVRCFLR